MPLLIILEKKLSMVKHLLNAAKLLIDFAQKAFIDLLVLLCKLTD